MNKSAASYTRGKGLLEPALAYLRTRHADRLIPSELRTERILDIGCGSYPYFLSHTSFEEKFAVDQLQMPEETAAKNRIEFHALNLNSEPTLPFKDNFFSIITLLAVVEHLNPTSMALLFKESYRILKPSGMVILTTPAAWADGLLKFMAEINLVSAEEIHEHAFAYTLPLLGWHFGQAGFEMTKVKFGYFEFMLNMWATAQK
jgi:SAM-dependent methyltransferase